MKKSRVILELILVVVIGGIWYVVLTTGMIYTNIRREWRKK